MRHRVLQFIGSFNLGGSERQAIDLCRRLKVDGEFDVYAATLNYEGALTQRIESIGFAEIPEFSLNSFFGLNFIKKVRKCAGYLRENRIDLIHTHDFYTNVFGMAAAKLAGTGARVTSKRETGGMRSRLQDVVERAAFAASNRIVVNSNGVADYLTDAGIGSEKIVRIYNAVERFASGEAGREVAGLNGLASRSNAKIITLVANLRHPVKNVPLLLDAAALICASDPNAHIVIAGEGELEIHLRKRAEALGLAQKVHFIGRCEDVPSLLSISYAAVMSSDAEGFSNSILEYMAAGKPVVATAVGGAREAVQDGVSGYLVPPGDVHAFAGRILELLSDPEKAKKFGAAGRESVVRRFSVEAHLENTKNLYRSLLSSEQVCR